ncbi:MAG: flagellar hook-basal body complex protein, partial [Sinobacterium sp.]
STYNAATSVTVFDSLGDSHVQTFYFLKDNTPGNENQWLGVTYIDDQPLADGAQGNVNTVGATSLGAAIPAFRIEFSSGGDFQAMTDSAGGALVLGDAISVPLGAGILGNGSDPTQTITTNFVLDANAAVNGEPTQFASTFEVTSLEQDGLAVGRLTGIAIDSDGLVRATYSNGTSEPIIRVALVRFANDQGLNQQSNTQWQESILSGEAVAGEAPTGTCGDLKHLNDDDTGAHR